MRFGQDPQMDFAPSEIRAVTPRTGRPPRMAVAFMGMLGPNGPLPLHLTAWARERILKHKDQTLVHFLDMLSHRFVGLFYRAWAINQKTVSYDRPHTDRWATYFASMEGLGQSSLRDRDRVQDNAKRFYVGRMAPQVKSAAGLSDILRDYFTVPVIIRQFIGQWIDLPEDGRCRLGESPSTGALGMTLIVGSRVWDCQMKFRVVVGPMSRVDYERFLPGRPGLHRLHDWVRAYAGAELDWDVQLILRKDDVPKVKLGESGLLGWTTWIGSKPRSDDAQELILSSEVAAA